MKKLQLIGAAMIVVLAVSAKNDPDYFVKKLAKGKEVLEIKDPFYKSLSEGINGGDFTLQAFSVPNEISYGNGPRYGFGGVVTASKAVTVDILAQAQTKSYALTADATGKWRYSTQIDETTNPTYLAPFFAGDVSVRINGGDAPLEISIYSPEPILITSPVYNPRIVNAYEIKKDAIVNWMPDTKNRNGVLVMVKDEEKDTRRLLLTPDDGALKLSDLSAYLPGAGAFEISLSRLEYKYFKASDGKLYRIVIRTTSYNHYKIVA